MILSLLGSDPGYVHSLSPIKKGRSGRDYYCFQLQTSPTKFTRTVGFDRSSHSRVSHFHTTGSPVKLVNVNEKNDQFFINEDSSFVAANSQEMGFKKKEQSQCDDSNIYSSIEIQLKDVGALSCSQTVNIEGVLTLGDEKLKEVAKRNGEMGFVKEDCIIEDDTGSATIHIWSPLTNKCESGKSYKMTDVSVKKFSGNTLLATTRETTICESSLVITQVTGPDLLLQYEKEILVKEFKLVG